MMGIVVCVGGCGEGGEGRRRKRGEAAREAAEKEARWEGAQ